MLYLFVCVHMFLPWHEDGSQRTAHLGVNSLLPQKLRIELRASGLNPSAPTDCIISPDSFFAVFVSVAAQRLSRMHGGPLRKG